MLGSATGFCQIPNVHEVNPSFETPVEPSGSATAIQEGAGTSTAVPGWTIVSTGAVFAINNDQNNPSNALVNQNGYQYLLDLTVPDMGYGGGGTVSQILSTSFAAGTLYELSVWAGNWAGNTGNHPAQLGDTIFIANSSGTVLASASLDSAPSNGSMAQFVAYLSSNGTFDDIGPIEIGFTGARQTSTSIMAVDDFELNMLVPLPEPNSLAMAAFGSVVGCILLAGARRKSLFKCGHANRTCSNSLLY